MHKKPKAIIAGTKSRMVTDKNSNTHATVRAIIIHFRLNWMRGMARRRTRFTRNNVQSCQRVIFAVQVETASVNLTVSAKRGMNGRLNFRGLADRGWNGGLSRPE